MAPELLFQELLDELVAERIAVGVREHLALGKLLRRFDTASGPDFRTAVSALLATSADEVRRIEAAFDRVYGYSEQPVETRIIEPPPERRWWTPAKIAMCAMAVLLVTALASWYLWHQFYSPRQYPFPWPALPTFPNPKETEASAPPEQPPSCPEAAHTYTESAHSPRAFGIAAFALFGLTLTTLGWRRRHARRGLAAVAKRRLDERDGPRNYHLAVPPPPRPERASYGAFSTALQRIGRQSVPSREIDPAGTVRETVRAFPLISLVRKIRRARYPIVIIEDTSAVGRPFRAKVRALVDALERDGSTITHLFCDGDPTQVSSRRFGRPKPLAYYEGAVTGSPVVVIGCDTHLPPAQATRSAAVVHLNPIGDYHLWPQGSRRRAVWPLTAAGLADAARAVAARDLRPGPLPQIPPVSTDDAQLFVALLALASRPTYELAELVRASIFPHSPEELILAARELIEQGRRPAVHAFEQLDPRGTRRRAMHSLLLRVSEGQRPEAGSAAELRWQRDRALARLALGDALATAALERLAGTAVAEELIAKLDAQGALASIRRLVTRRAFDRSGGMPMLGLGALLFASAVLFSSVAYTAGQHPVTRERGRVVSYWLSIAPTGEAVLRRTNPFAPMNVTLHRAKQLVWWNWDVSSPLALFPDVVDACYRAEAAVGDVVYVSNSVTLGHRVEASRPLRAVSFLPKSIRPGETFEISGIGFLTEKSVEVKLGERAVASTTVADDIIRVTTSLETPTGEATVSATFHPSGRVFVVPGKLAIVPGPPTLALTGITPSNGPPGSTVTILGSGFTTTKRRVKRVSVGFEARFVRFASDTALVVKTSASAVEGPASIEVEFDPGGIQKLDRKFTFASPPAVDRVEPDRAKALTLITVIGQDFQKIKRTALAHFGDAKAKAVIMSDTRIDIQVPSGPTGRVPLSLDFTPGGTVDVPTPFTRIDDSLRLEGSITIDKVTAYKEKSITIAAGTKFTVLHGVQLKFEASETLTIEGPASIDGTGERGASGADAVQPLDWQTRDKAMFENAKRECNIRSRPGGKGGKGGGGATIVLHAGKVVGRPKLTITAEGGPGGPGGKGKGQVLRWFHEISGSAAELQAPPMIEIGEPFECPPGSDGPDGDPGPEGVITE